MPAAIDYDFRILNRYKKVPWRWASSKTDMLTTEEDYQDLMPIIIENDNELKEIRFLKERFNAVKKLIELSFSLRFFAFFSFLVSSIISSFLTSSSLFA